MFTRWRKRMQCNINGIDAGVEGACGPAPHGPLRRPWSCLQAMVHYLSDNLAAPDLFCMHTNFASTKSIACTTSYQLRVEGHTLLCDPRARTCRTDQLHKKVTDELQRDFFEFLGRPQYMRAQAPSEHACNVLCGECPTCIEE